MILSSLSTLDKLGHYEVAGNRYLSKLLALQAANKDFHKVSFHFNEAVYDCYDWTQEPEPSVTLGEFYRRRAQQLRDKYDYLVLLYSGGPDSQNVLDTFVENNILLDELVNFNSYDQTRQLDGTLNNSDYYYNILPALERLKDNPNFRAKMTVVDEIEATKRFHADQQRNGNYEIMFNSSNFPSSMYFKGVWVKYVDHIWRMMLSGKKVGIIYGTDKPAIGIKDGKYCTYFADVLSPDIGMAVANDPDLRNVDFVELFYHSPDCTPLLIKQLHVLKNFMDRCTDDSYYDYRTDEWYTEHKQRSPFHCKHKILNKTLNYDIYHKLIYPHWNPAVVTHKTFYGWSFRQEDTWWFSKLDPGETRYWYKGFYKNMDLFKDMVTIQKDNKKEFMGMPTTATKPYFLEK